MREETRYRVTGSLFLLALAVICLPMLLDGAGLPARTLPDLPMDESLPGVAPLSSQAPESDYVARVDELRAQVDEQGYLTSSGTRFGEPVLTPGERRAVSGAGGGPERERTGQTAADEPGDRATEPGKTDTDRATDRKPPHGVQRDVWAVQVASFARPGNAEEFRTRLRRDGYEAFISTASSDGRVLSRVAVGPLLDRQRAEILRGELSARYDVEARLMAFSN